MGITWRSTFAVLATCLTIVGCGSDDDDDAAAAEPADAAVDSVDDDAANAGSVDACALLSEQEAGDILGVPIVVTGPAPGVGESFCEWRSESGFGVYVSVGSPGTAPGNEIAPTAMLIEPEPLAGHPNVFYVGSSSFEFGADERHNSVQVVSGDGSRDRASAETAAVLLQERIEQSG